MQPAAALYTFVGLIIIDVAHGANVSATAMLNTLRSETRESTRDLTENRQRFIDAIMTNYDFYRIGAARVVDKYYKKENRSIQDLLLMNSNGNRNTTSCLNIAKMEMNSALQILDSNDCNKTDLAPMQELLNAVSLETGVHIIAEIDSLNSTCSSQNGITFEKCVKENIPAKTTMLADFRENIKRFKQSSNDLLNNSSKFQCFGQIVSGIMRKDIPRFKENAKNCVLRSQNGSNPHK